MRDDNESETGLNPRALNMAADVGAATAAARASARRDDADAESASSALLGVRRLLRGRTKWAIAFVAAGLAAGALAGWGTGSRVYRSTAQIRIVSVLPQVLYKEEDKNLVQVYDAFAEAQSQLLQSQRVIGLAQQDPQWQALGRPSDDNAVRAFQGSLEVERKLEIISVHMNDATPEGAVAGVQSAVHAYQQVYQNDDRDNRLHRLDLLAKNKEELAADMADVRKRELAISSAFKADDLQALYDSKLQMVQSMDSSRNVAGFEEAAANDPIGHLPEPTFSPYLNERIALKKQMIELEAGGLSANHPRVVALQRLIDNVDGMIKARAVRSAGPADGYGEVKSELAELSGQLKKLTDLRGEEDVIKQQISETSRRMYQLHIEDEMSNRISLMADGEKPLGPYRDTRKTFAAAGGFGGGLLGFGLALCFCLLDRRFRDPQDLALTAHDHPVIAVIPRLTPELTEVEPAWRAAMSVHQLRMMLHARGGWGSQVFAVTSASPGSGKTSVALAMGVSAASAGFDTLLVDLDLSGAGMTARVGVVRPQPIGRLMLRRGVLSEGQLADAAAAKKPGRRFGEACIQLGLASEADVSNALLAQSGSRVGVMEALAGQPLNECVSATGVSRMSILPLGSATAEHAGSLSLPALLRLMDKARRQYDVVIVDTGPLFGSLEASLVAKAADGTVLVVSHGEERVPARKAKELLQASGVPLSGVVFNRADRNTVAPVTPSSGPTPTASKSDRSGTGRVRQFGPIARAVARYVPGDGEPPMPVRELPTREVAMQA